MAPIATGAQPAAAGRAATGTDTIIVRLSADAADPVNAATAAVRDATAGIAGVKSTRLIGPDTAAVTLDATLANGVADKVAKSASRRAGVEAADRSLTFVPASSTVQDYEWNLAPGYGVDAQKAWQTTLGKGVIVGVVDTGIATNTALPASATTKAHTEGDMIVGTTAAGVHVEVTNSSGQLCDATASSAGAFSCQMSRSPDANTDVTVTAADDLNRTSATSVTIRPTPVLDPTRGYQVTGTKTPDSSVTVRWTGSDGKPYTKTLAADPNTTWTTPLEPEAADGSTISATATDSSGSISKPGTVTADRTPPAAPSVARSNGAEVDVAGVETGATPSLRDAAGTAVPGTWTDRGDGNWAFTPTTALTEQDEVSVVLTDGTGNDSDPVRVVIDTTAPGQPDVATSDGNTIVITKVDGDASPSLVYTGNADTKVPGDWVDNGGGKWTFTTVTRLTEQDDVSVVLTDAVGNASAPQKVKIDTTSLPPEVHPTNGRTISGTAESNSTLTITYQPRRGAVRTATTTADEHGSWSTPLRPTARDGSTISVTATDEVGNVSDPTTVKVDATRPSPPVLEPTQGGLVAGTKEAGSSVTVTWTSEDGPQRTTLHADADVTWSTPLVPAAIDGSTISATVTDEAGNTSRPGTVLVDASAPSGFVVAPSNGHSVEVSEVEPDATLSLFEGDTEVDGDWADNQDGSWTFTPVKRLTEDGSFRVVVTDKSGNPSDPVTVLVDTTPPAVVIGEVSDSAVSGTAEAGAQVRVSYQSADSESHTTDPVTAGDAGDWSVALLPAAAPGSTVTATATDAVGNTSEATPAQVPVEPSPTPTETPSSESSDTASPEPSDTPTAESSPTSSESQTAEPGDPSSPSPSASDSTEPSEPDPGETESPTSSGNDQPVVAAADSSGGTVAGGATSETASSAGASETDTTVGTGTNAVGTVLPGRNFYDGDAANWTDPDAASHGTHVAGIIAASGLGGASAGVAPAVQVESLRAMNSSGGTMDAVIQAIYWGAGISYGNLPRNPYPVDVLNLSIQTQGASSCPDTLQQAINAAVNKGVVVVAAAGNYNSSIATSSPANCANVIVTTASTASGSRAGYSSWGTADTSSAWLVAAPGGSGDASVACTISSCPSWILSPVGGSLVAKSGTSMSAPHVAGVAALLKAVNPRLTPSEIARIIRGTATGMSDGCPTAVCGSGIVNAARAVAAARDNTPVNVATAVSTSVNVAVTGSAQVGAALTATAASSYSGLSYQWLRNGSPINGATTPYYRLVGADYGTSIAVRVATAIGGATATSSGLTVKTKGYLSYLKAPVISGTYKVKKTLKTTIGSWSPETPTKATYQWYRNGKKIKKATKATYKLTKSDRGKKIKVKVTVSLNGYYSPPARYSASHKVKR